MFAAIKKTITPFLPQLELRWSNPMTLIMAGLTVYTVAFSLLLFYLPQPVCWLMEVVGVAVCFVGMVRKGLYFKNNPLNVVCCLMLLYGLYLFLLFCGSGEMNVGRLITQPLYVLPILLPFFVLLRYTTADIQVIFSYVYLSVFIVFFHYALHFVDFVVNTAETRDVFWNDTKLGYYNMLGMVTCGMAFFFPTASFYFTDGLIPVKKRLLIGVTIVMGFLSALSFGRRSSSAFMIIIFLIPFLRFQATKKAIAAWCLVIGLVAGVAANMDAVERQFSSLFDRLEEDTRSGVEDAMLADMDYYDIIWGRGLNGRYGDGDDGRTMIETGYLFIILQKGLIYLLFYVMIIAMGAWAAFQKSKNPFWRSVMVYLLLSIAYMYPGGLPMFTLMFVTMFMMASIAMQHCPVPKRLV